MHHTPWTSRNSSLPSDRIKPKTKGASKQSKVNKASNQQIQEPSRSQEVRRIEDLLVVLNDPVATKKDPKGGCYCLARTHTLSPYTPLCRSCGLILCSVNQPQFVCPDCASALLSEDSRKSLIEQVESELANRLAKELEDQERAIEDARIAAGAFPSLASSKTTNSDGRLHPTPPIKPQQTHKVMSLTGSKNRVLVSSYTTKPPPTPNHDQVSSTAVVEQEVKRVEPPPRPPLATHPPQSGIPFDNLIDGNIEYISSADTQQASAAGGHKSGGRRRNKGKDKESGTSTT